MDYLEQFRYFSGLDSQILRALNPQDFFWERNMGVGEGGYADVNDWEVGGC